MLLVIKGDTYCRTQILLNLHDSLLLPDWLMHWLHHMHLFYKCTNVSLLNAAFPDMASTWLQNAYTWLITVKFSREVNMEELHNKHKNTADIEAAAVKMMLPFSSLVFLRSSGSMCTSCRMRGRRVTMPVPRGRMSLPTRLSKTELFPLLCRQ